MAFYDYRFYALASAIVLYAVFGQPTPDHYGVVEAFIGMLLIAAVGFSGMGQALFFQKEEELWRSALRVLLFYGLSVPFLNGALSGYSSMAIIRDIAPFLFMVLPLFLSGIFEGCERRVRIYCALLAFIGLMFALRSLSGADPLYYLANMPSVLFAAILCYGVGLTSFIERYTWRALGVFFLLVVIGAAAVFAMVEMQQRASLGAFMLAMGVICARLLWTHPKRMALFVAFCGGALVLYLPLFSDVVEGLLLKQHLVGLNSRAQEWAAVWDEVLYSPFSLLFGRGWGASFASPAVADIRVTFTHGLLSSMVLKTGLVGLVLSVFFLYALIRRFSSFYPFYSAVFLAALVPALIDVFLYASFKSLDFGLVLVLMSAPLCTYSQKEDRISRE